MVASAGPPTNVTAVGFDRSILNEPLSMLAVSLPALSETAPDGIVTAAPSARPESRVKSAEPATTPEVESVAVKRLVTELVYQPLAPAVPPTAPSSTMVGATVSRLTVREAASVRRSAWFVHEPSNDRPRGIIGQVLVGGAGGRPAQGVATAGRDGDIGDVPAVVARASRLTPRGSPLAPLLSRLMPVSVSEAVFPEVSVQVPVADRSAPSSVSTWVTVGDCDPDDVGALPRDGHVGAVPAQSVRGRLGADPLDRGFVVSTTVTVKLPSDWLPKSSLAVQVTVVAPSGKSAGTRTARTGQWGSGSTRSVAVGAMYAPRAPPVVLPSSSKSSGRS